MYQKLLFLLVNILLMGFQLFSQETWIRSLPTEDFSTSFDPNTGDIYELNNGNYLIQFQNNYFFEISDDGFVVEEHIFDEEYFVEIQQNPDGSFRALGAKQFFTTSPSSSSPRYYEFSDDFLITTEEVLGVDSVHISGNPFSIHLVQSALFHANGDISMVLQSNFPGGLQNVVRIDSEYNLTFEKENAFPGSINPLIKEDNEGNYVISNVVSTAPTIYKKTLEWETIWTNNLPNTVANFSVLSDGRVIVNFLDSPLKLFDLNGESSSLHFGIHGTDSYAYELPNGNLLVTGNSVDSTINSFAVCLREITFDGEEIWKHNYLFEERMGGRKVMFLPDGKYLIYVNNFINSENQVKVIKTGENGKLFDNQIYVGAKIDDDADCILPFNASAFPDLTVTAQGNEQYAGVSNNDGGHVFLINNGNYTLHAEVTSPFWELCENDIPIEVTNDAYISELFRLYPTETCPFPNLNMGTPLLRRCFSNYYYVELYNDGTTPLIDATLNITLDDFFELETVSGGAFTQSGNIVTVQVPEMAPFERRYLHVRGLISCDADLGQTHCFEAELITNEGCLQSYPPFIVEDCEDNIGSFDPNDITAYTDNIPEYNDYFEGQLLDYRVRFQNTGTDTAFNVVIETPTSQYLDLSTLKMTGSSHDYNFRMEGRKIVFEFNDINLPDSTSNLEESMGFINFSIQPFSNLPIGQFIEMQSDIFFDFNEPITTNLSSLEIVEPNNISEILKENEISFFPNPFQESFTLNTKKVVNNQTNLQLWNALGQLVKTVSINENIQEIDCSLLRDGVYFYTLSIEGERVKSGTIVKN